MQRLDQRVVNTLGVKRPLDRPHPFEKVRHLLRRVESQHFFDERWHQRGIGLDGSSDGRVFQQQQKLVGMMQRFGVPLMTGTDVSNPWVVPGFSVHDELALFVESGMTPAEALRAATLAPARFLGRTQALGAVARGKLADLVLLDADPLVDIHNTLKIQAVVAAGRYFDRAALDALLAGLARD